MSVTDYSDMEREIADAPSPKILPKGVEVLARIIAVRTGVSDKNDATWYKPVYDIPADPMVVEFSDFFWDLADRDKIDPKQYARALDHFRNFAASFKIDYSRPFSWIDDLIGKTGWIITGIRKSDEYGDQNTVSRYVTGQRTKKATPAIVGTQPIDENLPY